MSIDFHPETSKETLSRRAVGVLARTGANLSEFEREQIRLSSMELTEAHDVHAYYHLNGRTFPQRIGGAALSEVVLHVQIYPGMSEGHLMHFVARFMDNKRLANERALGNVSLGNEHAAVIAPLTEGKALGDDLPWDARSLTELIQEGLTN